MTQNIAIRPAEASDAGALAAFGEKTFLATFGHLYPPKDKAYFISLRYSLERTLQDIADPTRWLVVAYEGAELVGFLDCCQLGLPLPQPEAGALEISRLYLDESQKGTGLAQKLMEMALEWARAKGAPAIYLGVWSQNERAKRFYAKFGFEIVGAYHFKVGKTLDDERIMRLSLTSAD